MKISDDYRAKIKLWAANPQVIPLPPGPRLPPFPPQKFRSYEEMNRWKEDYLREIARQAPGNYVAQNMNEVIKRFNAAGVRYLLIGGQAMRLLGMPRSTMDWDFFIPPRDEANLRKINQVLEDALDAPVVALGPRGENFLQTYQTQWGVIQFHLVVPGLRRFEDSEASAVIRELEAGLPVKCLSGQDMLKAKQATNRPQDQEDILFLEELSRAGKLR